MNPSHQGAVTKGRGQRVPQFAQHMLPPIVEHPLQSVQPNQEESFVDNEPEELAEDEIYTDNETTTEYEMSPQVYFATNVKFDHYGDVIKFCRKDNSPEKYSRVFAELPRHGNYLLKTEAIDFVQETGIGTREYLFEFMSEVREAILQGQFGECKLLEQVGDTLLPVFPTLQANRAAFYTLGLAMANLIHLTGYSIPGLSPCFTMSLFCLYENIAPPEVYFPHYAKEVTDPKVLKACVSLQQVVDTDTVLSGEKHILVNTAFRHEFMVVGEAIPKYRAMYLQHQILYHHYIGRRLASIGYILEGLEAGGIMNYFRVMPDEVPQVFPEHKKLDVNLLRKLVRFPVPCKWLGNLLFDYTEMILGDQRAITKFWRMITGEDFINIGSNTVLFLPHSGSFVIFQICSREVYVPEGSTLEVFPSVFATDYIFDLPHGPTNNV